MGVVSGGLAISSFLNNVRNVTTDKFLAYSGGYYKNYYSLGVIPKCAKEFYDNTFRFKLGKTMRRYY